MILVSGYSPEVVLEAGARAPGVQFLSKPFSLRELVGCIARAVGA